MSDSHSPDRRSFVLGRLAGARRETLFESHIASLVVHVRPGAMAALVSAVGVLPGAEIHARDPIGKLVVTLETESEAEIVQRLSAIQNLPGVLSAALVFHHFDSDPS